MSPYTVSLKPAAARQLEGLPRDIQERIFAKLTALGANPRLPGIEKLRGSEDLFRVRVGDYRIVYQIQEDRHVVLVVKIGHRRDVYRGFKGTFPI
jgi:mRNA interferase RelE/StbE